MTTIKEADWTRYKEKIEKMKAKYPKELNIEGLEPALTSDIVDIIEQTIKEERERILKEIDTLPIYYRSKFSPDYSAGETEEEMNTEMYETEQVLQALNQDK